MQKTQEVNKLIEVLYRTSRLELNRPRTEKLLKLDHLNLIGSVLRLFKYFENTFLTFGEESMATEEIYPNLIEKKILEQAEYFASFPNLAIDVGKNYFLSPAVCYHVYPTLESKIIGEKLSVFSTQNRCFRNEKKFDIAEGRFKEFTMREIVFIGNYEDVERLRKKLIVDVLNFTKSLNLNGVIEKSSDPFFTSLPDSRGKKLLQQLKPLKFELKVAMPSGPMAIASFNLHEDFFGRSFNIKLQNGETATSGCVAFGIERWVLGFLSQYGLDIKYWPKEVKAATHG